MATNKEININGVMTPVTAFSHTAQEIDDATARALAGGAIDQLLAGKAPAGYGYGDALQLIGHDNITEDDFLAALESVYSNMPNNTVKQVMISDHPTLDGGVHFGQLWRKDATYGALIVYSYFGFQPAPIIRVKYNSAWKPWEYVNPPMMIGEEYRTTERYLGKPVYVKVVDFGPGANNTEKIVEHGASNAIVIDYGGYAKRDNGELSVPWKTHSTLSASDTVIVMTSNADYSGYSVYVWIKYYKTTD